jgi:ABC-type thiamine transport system substrate-binding protein
MKHALYTQKCRDAVRTLVFRRGSLRTALTKVAAECFATFPLQQVPYGDAAPCTALMDTLTDHHQRLPADVIAGMDEEQVRQAAQSILDLFYQLSVDEGMQFVDTQWKATYLRPMKTHY